MENMLTVEEVAEILKVKPITVRQMYREKRLRAFKIGKAWRTTQSILEEDIACLSRGEKPPPVLLRQQTMTRLAQTARHFATRLCSPEPPPRFLRHAPTER